MRDIRVRFSKTGRAKYISHLDLVRAMTRAMRRSGVPTWYTEGFNPRVYLNFLLPLPLGQEGRRELMDIRVEGDIGCDEIVRRLDAVMPEGLRIISAAEPWAKSAELVAAEYTVRLGFGTPADEDTLRRAEKLLESGELTAKKSSKKGRNKIIKEIRLADYIRSCSASLEDSALVIHTVTAAGSTENLNPALLAESLAKALGAEDFTAAIVRERLLDKQMKEFE